MNVLMLYPKFPEQAFWNTNRTNRILYRRPAEMPPLGLLTVAAYLPEDFQVRLVDRNVAEERPEDWQWCDLVFVSLMLVQREDYQRLVDLAGRYGKPVAVGGPFTHAEPELAAETADWVCFGEAEPIMPELIEDLRSGRRYRKYQGGNETDMHTVLPPRFDLLPNPNAYFAMPIQFSRGCPYRCEFCDIIEIYGRVPRTKTPGQVVREVESVYRGGFTGFVFLADDNFVGNRKLAKRMLVALAAWNRGHGYPYWFATQASLNLAEDGELMDLMAAANLNTVFIGIETPDADLLKASGKTQNATGDPLRRVRRIREHGIHVTAGFIVGFDNERRDVFEMQQAFITQSGIGVAMLGMLVALPHTQLWRRLQQEGRLLPGVEQGNQTLEGINFVPKGELNRAEYLRRFARLSADLYQPRAFFERIVPALLSLRKTQPPFRAVARMFLRLFGGFLRQSYYLGWQDRHTRGPYWKCFFTLLWKNPRGLEGFMADCKYYHHLHHHAGFVRQSIDAYLANPEPDDVLERVAE